MLLDFELEKKKFPRWVLEDEAENAGDTALKAILTPLLGFLSCFSEREGFSVVKWIKIQSVERNFGWWFVGREFSSKEIYPKKEKRHMVGRNSKGKKNTHTQIIKDIDLLIIFYLLDKFLFNFDVFSVK